MNDSITRARRSSFRFSFLLTLVTLLLLPLAQRPVKKILESFGVHSESGGMAGSFLVFYLCLGLILMLYRILFRATPLFTWPGVKVYTQIGMVCILLAGIYEYQNTHRSVEAAIVSKDHPHIEAPFTVDHAQIIQPESDSGKAYALVVTPALGLQLSTYTKGWFGWDTTTLSTFYPPAEDNSSSPSVFSDVGVHSSLVFGVYRSREPLEIHINGEPVQSISYQQLRPYVSEDLYVWYYDRQPEWLMNKNTLYLTAHNANGTIVDQHQL